MYLLELKNIVLIQGPLSLHLKTILELVLRQLRHLSFHTGMLNGQTMEHTGKFPIYVSEDSIFPEDGSLFGRYVTKKK